MHLSEPVTTEHLIRRLDGRRASLAREHRALLRDVAACDRPEVWEPDGARDCASWLSARFHISHFEARRWLHAGHVLERRPRLEQALESGRLGFTKVLELCRFVTAEDEERWIRWAEKVTVSTVRHRADVETRPLLEDAQDVQRQRAVWWGLTEDRKAWQMGAILPPEEGRKVALALDRIADTQPRDPETVTGPTGAELAADDEDTIDQRRADALVALASARLADDQDTDRATVIVHAELAALTGHKHAELDQGSVLHPMVLERLCCDARIQAVIWNGGAPVGESSLARTPSPSQMRSLKRRDRSCTFPGCGAKRFVHAHHIWHHVKGGPTELWNLILVCPFHHKLLHEGRWRVKLEPEGTTRWFRADGREYLPNAPP